MAGDFTLRQFTAAHSVDTAGNVGSYAAALEAFDRIDELQELKALARTRGGFGPGRSVLDVGCGFGLETLRFAATPGAVVAGIDRSADFIAEGRRRAAEAGLVVDFRVGEATALPFPAASFDCVRAERVLIYLADFAVAIREMRRVARPGGGIALIEPDFSTTTINLPNRPLVRRALAHEVDTAVAMSWLPGPLHGTLADEGFTGIERASRVLVFPQDLAAMYFHGIGEHAAAAGAISADELAEWRDGIDRLVAQRRLFGSIGYFLFTARA